MNLLHISESDGIYTIRQTLPGGEAVRMATRSRQVVGRAVAMYTRGEVIDREAVELGTLTKTRSRTIMAVK